ncbi:hypothetical protein [Polyangium fumosum]|uniref:Uncharacterized protein n=1 Tax=Polyangium fumosum TaxID=889272 RepID=A0A4U1JGS0_9BACT|nr:hypothetical protein [Polyangium fumosum]TKD11749.1 hypothetical protein E8A74_06320 [Polyangium fumosum]
MNAGNVNETAIEGLSLAHYAAVKAAVAEGFTLDEVLATEGLSPEDFKRADTTWKTELAADQHLLGRYAEALAHAEGRLDRTVEPLSIDATAWANFLTAIETHEHPLDLLATLGLGMNDLSRLARHWSRRLEAEPALAKRLAELRKKDSGSIPTIKIGPPMLRPSPMARARAKTKDAPEPLAPASLSVPDIVPRGMRHFTSVTNTEAAPGIPTGPALPFEPPRAAVVAPDAARVAPPLPEGMRHFTSLTGTTPAPDVTARPVLPFVTADEPDPALPPGMRHFTSLTGTTPAPDLPRGPALPFLSAPASKAPTPAAAPSLPLEHYACMCVEFTLYPTHSAAILARYGIHDDERRRLDGYWGAKVRQDAGTRALWERVYAEHWTRLGGPPKRNR